MASTTHRLIYTYKHWSTLTRTCISIKLHIICLLCVCMGVCVRELFLFWFQGNEKKKTLCILKWISLSLSVRHSIIIKIYIPYTYTCWPVCYCYSFNQYATFFIAKHFLYRNENKKRKKHIHNKKERRMKRNRWGCECVCVCDLPRDRNVISDENDFYRSITRQEKTTRRKKQRTKKEQISFREWK